MRYMFIVKSSQSAEPTPELMQAMHKMAQREIQAGRMLDDGGSGAAGDGRPGVDREGRAAGD